MDAGYAFLVGIGVGIMLLGLVDQAAKHFCPHGCELRFEQLTPEDRHD